VDAFRSGVAVVLAALGGVITLLADLWWATGHLLLSPSASTVTVLAGTVLAGAVLLAAVACLAGGARVARISAAVPLLSRARALREKSWHAAFLRQRDPDAAGRPRPRAPSAAPAAA
jgi:Family of unknown function (DUF6412)